MVDTLQLITQVLVVRNACGYWILACQSKESLPLFKAFSVFLGLVKVNTKKKRIVYFSCNSLAFNCLRRSSSKISFLPSFDPLPFTINLTIRPAKPLNRYTGVPKLKLITP